MQKTTRMFTFLSLGLALAGGCTTATGDEQPAALSREEVLALQQSGTSVQARDASSEVLAGSPEGARAAAAATLPDIKPIAQDEVDALRHGVAAARDSVIFCPQCLRLPDVTPVEDDRDQWLWDPNAGWYQGFAKGFTVKNIGNANAGTFHVAVLFDSTPSTPSWGYGFDMTLAAGASSYYQLTYPSYLGPACGQTATIIINTFNALPEWNYNNNVVQVQGYCFL